MIVGAQAPGSTQYDYPMLAATLFGLKFKVITGYKATPKINLAMERGEVHGTWPTGRRVKAHHRAVSRTRRSASWRNGRCASIRRCRTCR